MTEMPRRTGKWLRSDVPDYGWHCVKMVDLNDEHGDGFLYDSVCQMCEVTQIRYIHVMKHNLYPHELACGCVCAGYMTDNLEEAQRREARFKTRRALLTKPNTGKLRRKGWQQLSSSKDEYAFAKNGWDLPVRDVRVKVVNTPAGWISKMYCGWRENDLRYTTDPTKDWRAAALDGLEGAEQRLNDKEWIAAETARQAAEVAKRKEERRQTLELLQQKRVAEDALAKQFEAEGMSRLEASRKAYATMRGR